MKAVTISLLLFAVVLAACGGAEKEIVPNGEIVYNHVNLVVDENDWFGNVGVLAEPYSPEANGIACPETARYNDRNIRKERTPC